MIFENLLPQRPQSIWKHFEMLTPVFLYDGCPFWGTAFAEPWGPIARLFILGLSIGLLLLGLLMNSSIALSAKSSFYTVRKEYD